MMLLSSLAPCTPVGWCLVNRQSATPRVKGCAKSQVEAAAKSHLDSTKASGQELESDTTAAAHLARLSTATLKAKAQGARLSAGGSRSDLIGRIAAHVPANKPSKTRNNAARTKEATTSDGLPWIGMTRLILASGYDMGVLGSDGEVDEEYIETFTVKAPSCEEAEGLLDRESNKKRYWGEAFRIVYEHYPGELEDASFDEWCNFAGMKVTAPMKKALAAAAGDCAPFAVTRVQQTLM